MPMGEMPNCPVFRQAVDFPDSWGSCRRKIKGLRASDGTRTVGFSGQSTERGFAISLRRTVDLDVVRDLPSPSDQRREWVGNGKAVR
jgi:hypothetical protein